MTGFRIQLNPQSMTGCARPTPYLLVGLQVVDEVMQAVQALLDCEDQLMVLGAQEVCHLRTLLVRLCQSTQQLNALQTDCQLVVLGAQKFTTCGLCWSDFARAHSS